MSGDYSEEPWLREVRKKYIATSEHKVAALELAIGELARFPDKPESRQKLRTLLHNLTGSGASYGFPNVSVVARRLSSLLKRADDERMVTKSDLITLLENGLEELREAFNSERAAMLGKSRPDFK